MVVSTLWQVDECICSETLLRRFCFRERKYSGVEDGVECARRWGMDGVGLWKSWSGKDYSEI